MGLRLDFLLLLVWITSLSTSVKCFQEERSSDFESCPVSLDCPTKLIGKAKIQMVAKRQPDTVIRRGGRVRYRPEPPKCTLPACLSNPCPALHRCEETVTSYRCIFNGTQEEVPADEPPEPREQIPSTPAAPATSAPTTATACLSNPCPALHRCEETATSYRCIFNGTQEEIPADDPREPPEQIPSSSATSATSPPTTATEEIPADDPREQPEQIPSSSATSATSPPTTATGCPSYSTNNGVVQFNVLMLPDTPFQIQFSVRTSSSSVTVYLHTVSEPVLYYEIQISTTEGTYIRERSAKGLDTITEVDLTFEALSPNELRGFWIAFDPADAALSVENQDETHPLLMEAMGKGVLGNPIPVRAFGIQSSSQAEWYLLWHQNC